MLPCDKVLEGAEVLARWMFLGDESCRIFVGRMLNVSPKEIAGERTLVIGRGEREFEASILEDGKLRILTRLIPPEIEILVPSYSDDSAIELQKFDNCAIFEMFPFRKESTTDFLRLLEMGGEQVPDLLIVLMNEVDAENIEERLEIARSYYARKNCDVMVVEDDFKIFDVLHWHKPIISGIVEQIRNHELKDVCAAAEDLIDNYEVYLTEQTRTGCLSKDAKTKIISFGSVQGRSQIWMSYQKAALDILLPRSQSGGLMDLIALYREALYKTSPEDSFATQIWYDNEDCAQLRDKFQKKFKDSLKTPKKFQEFLSPRENKSERIYNSLISRGGRFEGIAEEFLAQYEYFLWTEIREILVTTLDERIQKLENIVS